jgi:hypothetical protein
MSDYGTKWGWKFYKTMELGLGINEQCPRTLVILRRWRKWCVDFGSLPLVEVVEVVQSSQRYDDEKEQTQKVSVFFFLCDLGKLMAMCVLSFHGKGGRI